MSGASEQVNRLQSVFFCFSGPQCGVGLGLGVGKGVVVIPSISALVPRMTIPTRRTSHIYHVSVAYGIREEQGRAEKIRAPPQPSGLSTRAPKWVVKGGGLAT